MRVKLMRYRRLVSARDAYGHKAAELEAEVEADEDETLAWDRLVEQVEAKLAKKDITEIRLEHEELDWKVRHLSSEHTRLTAEVDALRTSIEKLRQEKKDAGGKNADDEIPF